MHWTRDINFCSLLYIIKPTKDSCMNSMFKGFFVLAMLAGPVCAEDRPYADMDALRKAISEGDRETFSDLLVGKKAYLSGDEAVRARVLLLERLAVLDKRNEAERKEAAEGLLTLFPDDQFVKALAAGEGVAAYSSTEAQVATAGDSEPERVTPAGSDGPVVIDRKAVIALEKGDAIALVDRVLIPGFNSESLGTKLREAEELILAYVKPLPAANTEANMRGYKALSLLEPENAVYLSKAERYASANESRKSAIVSKMKKTTDDFNGNTFYKHPNAPRYANSRTYFQPYVGSNGSQVWMRFEVHYTDDEWLFTDTVAFNIDGQIIRLPAGKYDWKRDNGSGDIWEWLDLAVDDEVRNLIEKIAASKKTVAQFDGSNYRRNITVGETDKQVMRDMLLLEEVLTQKAGG